MRCDCRAPSNVWLAAARQLLPCGDTRNDGNGGPFERVSYLWRAGSCALGWHGPVSQGLASVPVDTHARTQGTPSACTHTQPRRPALDSFGLCWLRRPARCPLPTHARHHTDGPPLAHWSINRSIAPSSRQSISRITHLLHSIRTRHNQQGGSKDARAAATSSDLGTHPSARPPWKPTPRRPSRSRLLT